MEHTTSAVLHHERVVGGGRKEIYRVTIILSVLTIIELAFGFSMYYIHDQLAIHFIKGVILILMIAKAFYIVAYFSSYRSLVKTTFIEVSSVHNI